MGRWEERCFPPGKLASLCPWPRGGGVLLEWRRMRLLSGDGAEGQVEKGGGCEGKCLQGGRGSLGLQV